MNHQQMAEGEAGKFSNKRREQATQHGFPNHDLRTAMGVFFPSPVFSLTQIQEILLLHQHIFHHFDSDSMTDAVKNKLGPLLL